MSNTSGQGSQNQPGAPGGSPTHQMTWQRSFQHGGPMGPIQIGQPQATLQLFAQKAVEAGYVAGNPPTFDGYLEVAVAVSPKHRLSDSPELAQMQKEAHKAEIARTIFESLGLLTSQQVEQSTQQSRRPNLFGE